MKPATADLLLAKIGKVLDADPLDIRFKTAEDIARHDARQMVALRCCLGTVRSFLTQFSTADKQARQ